MFQIQGKISIPVPGVPVRATSLITRDNHGITNDLTKFSCHAALFQTWYLNTGRVYIGLPTMNKATGEGVSAVLAIPMSTSIPSFSASLTLSPSGIDLSELWLDVDVANEGPLVTVLVT